MGAVEIDTSKLTEKDLCANCYYIDFSLGDRTLLEEVIRPKQITMGKTILFDRLNVYCSLARDNPPNFRQVCPSWLVCPYADGKTREVQPRIDN